MKKGIIADGALLLITVFWGLDFVIAKDALEQLTPYWYLGMRFIIATFFMVIFFHRQLKTISKEDIKGGLVIGLCLFAAFTTQTIGLVYTTPSKSGFISGTYCVLVPFLAYFITKVFPGWYQVAGAVITFLGLGLVSFEKNFTVNYGDILTLICAAFFALQIIYIGYYVKKSNPINVAVIQTAVVGLLSAIMAVCLEPIVPVLELKIWLSVLYAALVCTACAFAVQNLAQQYTVSTHAAVILCSESVFAGVFSVLLWGETLTFRTLFGFVLIFIGILVTELLPFSTKG